MSKVFLFFFVAIVCSCTDEPPSVLKVEKASRSTAHQEPTRANTDCDYLDYYKDKGNKVMDTIRVNGKLTDLIDDTLQFSTDRFGYFVNEDNKVFKKAHAHQSCGDQLVAIEYFQDFTFAIDLDTYEEIGDSRFFSSSKGLFFWWGNSGGDMAIGIDNVDIGSFEPADSFCGGYDKNGVLYGSPNRGVFRLRTPKGKFELIPKEDNYWNTPEHYLIANGKVYDVVFDSQKDEPYYCELNAERTVDEIMQLRKN